MGALDRMAGDPMTPRRPRPHRPHSTGWQKAECDLCAAPVLIVVDDDRNARIIVNVPHHKWAGDDPKGTVAARLIGNQNHGFIVTPSRPRPEGYHLFRLHADTCEETEPAHVQESLFNPTEGTTHP